MTDDFPNISPHPDSDDVLTSRHGPQIDERAAARARTIVESARRTELGGAAEFLHALLSVPVSGGADAQLRGLRAPEGGSRSAERR